MENWLHELGFLVWRKQFGETENLYASWGAGGVNVCLAGHIDVVPAGDVAAWDSPPFVPVVRDGVLYGRGAEDMKGAVAAMVAAAADFVKQGVEGKISILMTADEEGDGTDGIPRMLHWLQEQGQKLDYCLVGEPTNPDFLGQMCKVGRRGSLLAKLRVIGKQGHVAYPALAENPNTRLINMLHALKAAPIDAGSEFFPPSNLEVTSIDVGNPTSNLIPAEARAVFNIRFNDLHSPTEIQEYVRNICEQVGGEYELQMRVSGDAFLTNNDKLKNALVGAVEKTTGHKPNLSTTGGTSDARIIKDFCPVIEFGTTGATAHKVNECVAVDVLYGLRDVYREFLLNMFCVD